MLPSVFGLRCFVAAAKMLHFGRAARTVALSPTAFSAQIRSLEAVVGKELFARTTRSVQLTEAGLALLPRAETALGAVAACVDGHGEMPVADVVLGTRQELGLSWVVPQLDRLLAELPRVDLHLWFGSSPDLVLRLRTGEVDAVVTSARLSDPKLAALPLHREDYVLVAAPSVAKARPVRRPQDLAPHTVLDATPDLPLFRYFAEGAGAPVPFAKLVRLGSIAAIRARVLAGAGVAVLPLYFVRDDLAKKRLVRLLPKARIEHDTFRLVFRDGDPKRRVYERMAEVLREAPLK